MKKILHIFLFFSYFQGFSQSLTISYAPALTKTDVVAYVEQYYGNFVGYLQATAPLSHSIYGRSYGSELEFNLSPKWRIGIFARNNLTGMRSKSFYYNGWGSPDPDDIRPNRGGTMNFFFQKSFLLGLSSAFSIQEKKWGAVGIKVSSEMDLLRAILIGDYSLKRMDGYTTGIGSFHRAGKKIPITKLGRYYGVFKEKKYRLGGAFSPFIKFFLSKRLDLLVQPEFHYFGNTLIKEVGPLPYLPKGKQWMFGLNTGITLNLKARK